MDTVHINIFDSYWEINETDIIETGRKLRFYGTIQIQLDIEEFEYQLHQLIMEQKNDGLEIERNSYGESHFVNVFLFLGEEQDEEYNIDYIHNFLNRFPHVEASTNEHEVIKYDKFIYALFGDMEDVIKLLEDEGVDFELISQTKGTYDRGAGDFWVSFVIGIAQNASWDFVKAIGGKLKNKFSDSNRVLEVAYLNANQLQKNLAEIANINEQDLRLISFSETAPGEEKYNVEYRTISEKFKVKSNKNGDILEFKRSNLRTVTTA